LFARGVKTCEFHLVFTAIDRYLRILKDSAGAASVSNLQASSHLEDSTSVRGYYPGDHCRNLRKRLSIQRSLRTWHASKQLCSVTCAESDHLLVPQLRPQGSDVTARIPHNLTISRHCLSKIGRATPWGRCGRPRRRHRSNHKGTIDVAPLHLYRNSATSLNFPPRLNALVLRLSWARRSGSDGGRVGGRAKGK